MTAPHDDRHLRQQPCQRLSAARRLAARPSLIAVMGVINNFEAKWINNNNSILRYLHNINKPAQFLLLLLGL
jgi:hypothetical protein